MSKKRGLVRERIIRVILNNPDGNLSKYRIAKLINSAYSWVHEFLKEFENNDLIKDTKVTKYAEIISFWRDFQMTPDKKEYMIKNPFEILKSTKLY